MNRSAKKQIKIPAKSFTILRSVCKIDSAKIKTVNMKRKITLLICLLICGQTVFSQSDKKNDGTITPETKKQAVILLRDTFGEINNLRTIENRLGFSAEMASMLWAQDAKEARTIFAAMIGDYNQMLAQYDSQFAALGGGADETQYYGGFLGGGDQSDKGKLMRKITRAMSVRQQIASSLAEHDPQAAFEFYESSLQIISNQKLRDQMTRQDSYQQVRLLKQIAETDAGKASEYGRKSLSRGLNYEQISLLQKIYEKDADKGAEFASAIADKLKSDKSGDEQSYYLTSVIRMGADSLEKTKTTGKTAMLSEQQLRDLTEIMAQELLKKNPAEISDYGNLDLIEKFAPSRAAQIRVKTETLVVKKVRSAGIPPPPLPPVRSGNSKNSQKSDAENAEQLAQSIQSLTSTQLPKEEREKFVAQARKAISSEPNKQAKILALTALAAQVAKLGDRELADQIMSDARGLVVSQPKNYQDFMEVLLLTSGYAQSAPDKAFPLLEDAIFRINDTIAAAVKIGEFIDASNEMIDGGEVQIVALSNGGLGSFTNGLAVANGTIRLLAAADFEKTRALTDKFDRPEARILAKMLVLRAVLDDKQKVEDEN